MPKTESTAKPTSELYQLVGRIEPVLGDKFKIALIKHGQKKDEVITAFAKFYIKNGLPE